MDLYLINCTKQKLVINLRLPEQIKLVPFLIPIGQQKLVLSNSTKDDIDNVLDQLKYYGVINMANVDSTKGVHGIAYSVRSVSSEKIALAVEAHDGELDKQSSDIMDKAAVASNNEMERILSEVGATVKNSGIEIEEVVPLGHRNEKSRNKKVSVER